MLLTLLEYGMRAAESQMIWWVLCKERKEVMLKERALVKTRVYFIRLSNNNNNEHWGERNGNGVEMAH